MIGMHIADITGAQAYQQYRQYVDVVFSGLPVTYERDVERPDGRSAYIEVTMVPHADGGGSVLLYLNIDELKAVNDRYGHAAGDECLRQIAALLRANTLRGQTLARLGSDEFGILLENVTLESARHTAEKLREAMQALHFSWQGKWSPLTVSIGIVALAGQSVTDALAQGDAACRTANNRGRNRSHVYQAGDQEIALRHSQLEWRDRIIHSLHHDRFCLYRQSIAPLRGPVG